MAESNERKAPFSVSDDMIKETLKSGLTGIKASDKLINITLERCQTEIEKKQKKDSRKFIIMTYKLGAPLAAGALALVLILNSGGLFTKKTYSGTPTAMEGPVPSAAAVPEDAAGSVNINTDEQVASYGFAAPQVASESTRLPGKGTQMPEEPSSGLSVMRFGEDTAALNSLANRSANNDEPSPDKLDRLFTAITELYNLKNGTKLGLAKEGITRIYTLPKSGVNAETLQKANDFHEILSGEGYWALPLKNQEGIIDTVLTVAEEANNNPAGTSVSDSDTVYSVEEKEFIVSSLEKGSFIGSELYELFDKNAISGLIREAGYKYDNKSEMIIADINYGTDFIVLTQAENEKLVVPLLTNEGLFGVVNRKVYTWPEFVRTISSGLGQ
ncbi:MAG: hypothetical protein GX022_08720 [Clostridiaceae bacterium]|nr:hypothetical protein [Clostridiaceae bacterium]